MIYKNVNKLVNKIKLISRDFVMFKCIKKSITSDNCIVQIKSFIFKICLQLEFQEKLAINRVHICHCLF